MEQETLIPDMGAQSYEEDLYSRSTSSGVGSNTTEGTYIPEMHVNAEKPAAGPAASAPAPASRPTPSTKEEAVVGFLYSISRKGIGEYWPLRLGANTIGRSADCNIQLNEMTVSDKHAVLNIRKMRSSSDVIASIRDAGSKNGMFLNDEELDFENHTCKNGDIITVGTCYQLLLLLINTQAYGLKVAEDFQPVAPKVAKAAPATPFGEDTMYRPRKRRDEDGTVDLGGASPFMSSGGTKVL